MAAEQMTMEQKVQAGLARLNHHDPAKRLQGVAYLGRLGKHSQSATPAIVELLKDGSVHMRKMAALVLGEIGGPVDLVIPALLPAIQDNDPGVRRRAAIAIHEMIQADAVALLLVQARLSTAPPHVRQATLTALQQIGTSRAA